MTGFTTLYIALLDEDVEVWKPMQGSRISGSKYLIIGDETDPDFESLQFKPGDTVICEERLLSGGQALVAVRAV
jgi:hypothetical protein